MAALNPGRNLLSRADEQENTAEEENEVGLDEPYVLVRETFTSNGTVTEYGY